MREPYTKEERTKILEAAAREHIRNDPNIDRFQLAQLLIAAADRFIGPVVDEEPKRCHARFRPYKDAPKYFATCDLDAGHEGDHALNTSEDR